MYIPIFSIVQNDSRFSESFKTAQEFKEEINEGKILPVECVSIIYFLPNLENTSTTSTLSLFLDLFVNLFFSSSISFDLIFNKSL